MVLTGVQNVEMVLSLVVESAGMQEIMTVIMAALVVQEGTGPERDHLMLS